MQTNQFAVRISEETEVFMYAIEFTPTELEPEVIEKALDRAEKDLDRIFSVYATRGLCIYAKEQISEDVTLTVRVSYHQEVTLRIIASSGQIRKLRDLKTQEGELNQAVQQLIQILIQKTMKKAGL